VNLHTAPGHATLFTGAYTDGHNIIGNDWWSHEQKKPVSSVEDKDTKLVGVANPGRGASPHNLTATTIGDELREATNGQAKVFGISLKDRSAILPAGHSGTAYWIANEDGSWVTSTYYMPQLPAWAAQFNRDNRAEKYWNLDWPATEGMKPRRTTKDPNKPDFYHAVGGSPFGATYELEFAKELVLNEKLGTGAVTDLLTISISTPDISGHDFGPDSPEQQAVLVATDKALADFFGFLGRQVGLANLWITLSADHGIPPTVAQAKKLKLPNGPIAKEAARTEINAALAQKLGRKANFIPMIKDRNLYLDPAAFGTTTEADAEEMVAAIMRTPSMKQKLGILDAVTPGQIASGRMADNELSRKWAHSYAPLLGEWYVFGLPGVITLSDDGSDHLTPWSYDSHVPLGFFGLAFQPGSYRSHAEPVDLSVTLTSLLGLNKPSHAVGRVLNEAIKKDVQ
jgi:hypothetical protein